MVIQACSLWPFSWNICFHLLPPGAIYAWCKGVFLEYIRRMDPIFTCIHLVCVFLLKNWDHWCWEMSLSLPIPIIYLFTCLFVCVPVHKYLLDFRGIKYAWNLHINTGKQTRVFQKSDACIESLTIFPSSNYSVLLIVLCVTCMLVWHMSCKGSTVVFKNQGYSEVARSPWESILEKILINYSMDNKFILDSFHVQ